MNMIYICIDFDRVFIVLFISQVQCYVMNVYIEYTKYV